jgi:hypothetical protein
MVGLYSGLIYTADYIIKERISVVKHILLVKFKAHTCAQDLTNLEQAFYQLKSEIAGIESVEFGENNSPEGLNKGYSHGIVIAFRDLAARDAYLTDSFHETLKLSFVPMIEDIVVLDYSH